MHQILIVNGLRLITKYSDEKFLRGINEEDNYWLASNLCQFLLVTINKLDLRYLALTIIQQLVKGWQKKQK